MSKPVLPTKLEIARAAIMRGIGRDWDSIAARLGRTADRVRNWPTQFPEIWDQCFRYALKRHAQIAANEAVLVMRNLLRQSKCEKTQLAIAKSLLRYRQKLRELDSRGK